MTRTPVRKAPIVAALVGVIALALALVSVAVLTFRDQPDRAVAPPVMTIEQLVDPSGQLQLADLAEADQARFAPVRGSGINLGYVRTAVWLRLTIASPAARDMLLSLTPNIVDLIDIHVMPPAGGAVPLRSYALGDHRPLSPGFSALDETIPLTLAADRPTRILVRAQAVNTVLGLQFALLSPIDHVYHTTVVGLVSGAWFGGMMVLLAIQLVFYYYDRRPYFILLAVSTLLAILVYVGTLGLSRLFLFPQGGIDNDMFTACTSWLGISATTLAARQILDVQRVAPVVDRIFLAGIALGVVGVAFAIAGENMLYAPFAQMLMAGLTSLGAWQAVRTIDAADTSTRLRAAAFVALWLGVILLLAQRSGVAPLPEWVTSSYAVAVVIYTVLLTGALAHRLRSAEIANARMREEALAAAHSAEQYATRLVDERTRELAAARQAAEEALDAELDAKKGQVRFMEVISHQYRTPLATIQTQVSNIEVSLPAADAANRQRVGRVRRAIARLVEVLEVNLARSRLQGAAFQPRPAMLAVGELVEEAAARARDLLNADIAVSVPPHLARTSVLVDREMLILALINLLENAAKFQRPNHRQAIRVSVAQEEAGVLIAVADEGIGIAPEDLTRVLEPRFRGSNARHAEGTGTGLSLVARIVAAHKGTISVVSTLGEGTTVRVMLPAASTAD